MRTKSSKRAWLAGILGGTTVSAGLMAAGDPPLPYPSVSPVLPAALPPTPVLPGGDVKPAAATIPTPPVPTPTVPAPTVPKVETPKPAVVAPEVLPVPSVPATVPTLPAVPNLSTVPTPTVATPSTFSVPVVPTAPAPKPVADVKPAVGSSDTKSAVTPASGTVKISIGATPGVLDNVGKLDAALVDSKAAYAKIHDYSCHFIKQERVRGKLTPDVIHELHVRTSPFSIYTKAVQPKDYAGVEVVSVAGRFATNQVRYKPNGGTFLTVSADDSRAATGRHPADHVGLATVLGTVEKMLGTERKLGHPVVVTVGAYSYAGKPVMRYEVVCEKPHAHRYCHRAVLFVDKDTNLPVRFEAYDEPRGASGPGGDLLESYSFVNLKLNVGHSAAVFDR